MKIVQQVRKIYNIPRIYQFSIYPGHSFNDVGTCGYFSSTAIFYFHILLALFHISSKIVLTSYLLLSPIFIFNLHCSFSRNFFTFLLSDFLGVQKTLMLKAMRHWENNSCLTFVERTKERDYIFFQKGACG